MEINGAVQKFSFAKGFVMYFCETMLKQCCLVGTRCVQSRICKTEEQLKESLV